MYLKIVNKYSKISIDPYISQWSESAEPWTTSSKAFSVSIYFIVGHLQAIGVSEKRTIKYSKVADSVGFTLQPNKNQVEKNCLQISSKLLKKKTYSETCNNALDLFRTWPLDDTTYHFGSALYKNVIHIMVSPLGLAYLINRSV